MKFKVGNHAAEEGIIMASTQELAESVGKAWCEKNSTGLLTPTRFIRVDDPVLADESILGVNL